MKTLVIILSETRAYNLTFENFKKNVIDELHADLCLCIGVKTDYDYNNPFYNLSKYNFLYNEPTDYGDAMESAYKILSENKTIDIHWREFLKIKDQFMGGIKDANNQHPGSAGILIFFRWFLLQNLIENNLINEYDRFIITRSDFIYQLPHPKIELLDEKYIWIPDSESYGGYTDRHAILSKQNIQQYLNIFNQFVLQSKEYFMKMQNYNQWNLEKLIKFHLQQSNIIVKHIPYIMYSIREINGTTRWSIGKYRKDLGYYIKYESEYEKSNFYKNNFKKSKSKYSLNEFYKKYIETPLFIESNIPKSFSLLPTKRYSLLKMNFV
jgi:hypothetical protein